MNAFLESISRHPPATSHFLEGYAKRCEVFPKDMHVFRVVGTFYVKVVHGNVSTSRKIGSPLKVLMQKDVRSSRRMYIL